MAVNRFEINEKYRAQREGRFDGRGELYGWGEGC
jgi:hypothetical protein